MIMFHIFIVVVVKCVLVGSPGFVKVSAVVVKLFTNINNV